VTSQDQGPKTWGKKRATGTGFGGLGGCKQDVVSGGQKLHLEKGDHREKNGRLVRGGVDEVTDNSKKSEGVGGPKAKKKSE